MGEDNRKSYMTIAMVLSLITLAVAALLVMERWIHLGPLGFAWSEVAMKDANTGADVTVYMYTKTFMTDMGNAIEVWLSYDMLDAGAPLAECAEQGEMAGWYLIGMAASAGCLLFASIARKAGPKTPMHKYGAMIAAAGGATMCVLLFLGFNSKCMYDWSDYAEDVRPKQSMGMGLYLLFACAGLFLISLVLHAMIPTAEDKVGDANMAEEESVADSEGSEGANMAQESSVSSDGSDDSKV